YTLSTQYAACPECPVPGIDPVPCDQCQGNEGASHYQIDWFGQVGACAGLGCGTGDFTNQFAIVAPSETLNCQWECISTVGTLVGYTLRAMPGPPYFWRLTFSYAGNASATYESAQSQDPLDCLGANGVPLALTQVSDGFNDCTFAASSVTITAIPDPGGGGAFAMQAPPPASRGLGDTIARATSAIGIKPCKGCDNRRDTLNRLVPYRPI
ncbi:unnamed protein product, partial [marine sediment metagenome]